MEIISLSWNPTSDKIVTSSLDTKIFIRNLKDNSIQNLEVIYFDFPLFIVKSVKTKCWLWFGTLWTSTLGA